MKKMRWIFILAGLVLIGFFALLSYEPTATRLSSREIVRVVMPNGVVKITLWATKKGSPTIPIDGSILPLPFMFDASAEDPDVAFTIICNGDRSVNILAENARPPNYRPPQINGGSFCSFKLGPNTRKNQAKIICTYTPVKSTKR